MACWIFKHTDNSRQTFISRSSNIVPPNRDEVVFEEVVHDPNFKYRILKDSGNSPLHVDPIYKILYPGGVRRK